MKRYPGVRKPPKPTTFPYPNGHKRVGKVENEVYEKVSGKGGDYLFVVQEIYFDDEPKKIYVRFGYYRKEKTQNRWHWGSRRAYTSTVKVTKRLTEKAKRILRLKI